MKSWLGGVGVLALLYACTGDDPAPVLGGSSGGPSNDGGLLSDAPAAPALGVEATPRVFVPPNVATDVTVTITRAGFDGPVKIDIERLPPGVTADSAPTIAAGETTATIRLSTSSSVQAFSRAKLTATREGAAPITVSTDVEVTLRGKSGDLDTTFGVDGVIDLSSSNVGETIMDATVDAEGRIYLLLPDLGATTKCRVFRTTPNGAIDASGWGTGGIVDFARPAAGAITCTRLALQRDGKVLVTGLDELTGGNAAWVARVAGSSTNGSFLDASYGTGGFVLLDGVGADGIVVDRAERALVRGQSGPASGNFLKRVTTAGVLDSSFATPPESVLGTLSYALVATPDGVVYGGRNGGSDVFRLSEGGVLDTTFGENGFLAAPVPETAFETELTGLALDRQGRVIGIGKSDSDGTPLGSVVVRLSGNTFDPTFGKGGSSLVTGPHDLYAGRLVVDEADGIIVASDEERSMTDSRVVLTRWGADGVVDPIFSANGIRPLPTLGGRSSVQGLILQEQRVLVLLFNELAGVLRPKLVRLWR